jgi:hypothetical protein
MKNLFIPQFIVIRRVKGLLAALLMLLSSSIIYAQTIALWTFETSHPNNSGPYSAETGTGIATAVHAGTSTFSSPSGNGSSHSFRANNWTAGDYFQFAVSSIGYENITFSFSQTSSARGPKTFEVQVSTDGTSFTTLAGSSYNVVNNNWNVVNSNATSLHSFNLPGIGNQPTLVIRLKVANGSTAANGSAITASGTSRIDNVSIMGSSPLPVTISSFTGTEQNGKNVLSWTLQSERNISHYEVESSKDGNMFYTLGKVDALNRSGSATYSFTDATNDGITYYRLKIADTEAGYTFSEILAIEGRKPELNISLSANVVQDILPVAISENNNYVSLKIFDIGGSMRFDQSYSCTERTTINLDIGNLPRGTYILKASAEGFLKTLRFVKY